MDACIFTMTINTLMAVYGADLSTQVDQLGVNDKVCVTRIEHGWAEVHFTRGNTGHTGFLKDVAIRQNAQPTEPTQREEEYNVPPPAPPQAPEQQKQNFERQAPNQDFVVRPTAFVMQCHPLQSTPYSVVYVNGHAAVIGSKSNRTHEYPVIKEHDDQLNHIFNITMQAPDQERALFAAFDYSQRGQDTSVLKTQLPGQPKLADKCFMDWMESK